MVLIMEEGCFLVVKKIVMKSVRLNGEENIKGSFFNEFRVIPLLSCAEFFVAFVVKIQFLDTHFMGVLVSELSGMRVLYLLSRIVKGVRKEKSCFLFLCC